MMIGMIDRMAGLRHVLAQSKHLSKSTPRAHFSRFPFIPLYTRGTRTARVLLASTCVYAQLYAIHINNTVCVCTDDGSEASAGVDRALAFFVSPRGSGDPYQGSRPHKSALLVAHCSTICSNLIQTLYISVSDS